jgi:hypothetical protein
VTRISAIIRRIAVAGALAVSALGIAAASASAGENEQITTEGGTAVFTHRGDRILAHDERRDGYGVAAVLTWNDDFGGHEAKVIDGRSSGGPDRKTVPLPEGTTVWLSLCYTKNGRGVKCSLTQRAEA